MKNIDWKATDSYLNDFKNELNNGTHTNLNVNMDMDGCLSAAIMLLAYPDFRICGYNDSAIQYYMKKDVQDETVVNVDLFCTHANMMCIDNHINSVSPTTMPLKYNPNFMCGFSKSDYGEKYPFSTFVFLCAVLEHFNPNIFSNIDIGAEINGSLIVDKNGTRKIRLFELMLRADSVLYNSIKFYDNAEEWWDILIKISGNNNGIIHKLYRAVDRLRNNTGFDEKYKKNKSKIKTYLNECNKYYEKISKWFEDAYMGKRDGFKSLSKGFYNFFHDIFRLFGVTTVLPRVDELVLYTYRRIRYVSGNPDFFEKLIKDGRMVSYAFVESDEISLNIRTCDENYFLNEPKMFIRRKRKEYSDELDPKGNIDPVHYNNQNEPLYIPDFDVYVPIVY